jgi:hypothetical protein
MQLTIGSTSSFAGTTAWTFSTPVATQTLGTIFQWFAYDTSAYVAANGNAPIGGGISTFQCFNIGAAQSLGASIPFTWATGDYVARATAARRSGHAAAGGCAATGSCARVLDHRRVGQCHRFLAIDVG